MLAEILSVEKPKQYFESHAGSGAYALTHSRERDHGIFYLVDHAGESSILGSSAYLYLLKALGNEDGVIDTCPGSSLIAMQLLGPSVKYLFCDIDGGSLQSISEKAVGNGIPRNCVELVEKDGIVTLEKAIRQFSNETFRNTFFHIDPSGRDTFRKSDSQSVPADFFYYISNQGCP